MPQLHNGSEVCDTCGKAYIALHGQLPCICEVDATHTDPIQELTGVALKYRQRARVAETLNVLLMATLIRAEKHHQGQKSEIGNEIRETIALFKKEIK